MISGTKILPFKVPLKEVSLVTKRYNTFKIRCKICSFLEFIFYVRNCCSHGRIINIFNKRDKIILKIFFIKIFFEIRFIDIRIN